MSPTRSVSGRGIPWCSELGLGPRASLAQERNQPHDHIERWRRRLSQENTGSVARRRWTVCLSSHTRNAHHPSYSRSPAWPCLPLGASSGPVFRGRGPHLVHSPRCPHGVCVIPVQSDQLLGELHLHSRRPCDPSSRHTRPRLPSVRLVVTRQKNG